MINTVTILLTLFLYFYLTDARNSLSNTPPMGWMSWEIFRCNLDCSKDKSKCISEFLYMDQADVLVAEGYLKSGYDTIHLDDCWESNTRHPDTNELYANTTRFPSGMKKLGQYLHDKNIKFGLYTDEGNTTCGGYPGSQGFEELDAKTFGEWKIDYLKTDGCNYDIRDLKEDYYKMGKALETSSGRDIVYSCSYPAYLGKAEKDKPFTEFIMEDGCNLWRNWADIQCNWNSLSTIIDYFGNSSEVLAAYAGPGHWHDPDMLLIGANCLTTIEEETQMAIWSILAAPLIMGNDLRKVSLASKQILQNKVAISINQDPLGQMGIRLNDNLNKQIWYRNLFDGSIAVVFYNKDAGQSASFEVSFDDLLIDGIYHAHDIFKGEDLGKVKNSIQIDNVPLHGCKFLKLTKVNKSSKVEII